MKLISSEHIRDPAGAEILSFYDLTFSERPTASSPVLVVGTESRQKGQIKSQVIGELQSQFLWPEGSGYQLSRQELKSFKAAAVLGESVEYLRDGESFLLATFSPSSSGSQKMAKQWEDCKEAVSKSSEPFSTDLIYPALDALLKSNEPKEQLLAVRFFHSLCHHSERLATAKGFLREVKTWFETYGQRDSALFRIWETHRKLDGLSIIPRLTELRSVAGAVARAIPLLAQLRLGDFYWGGHTLWHLRQLGGSKILSDQWKMSVNEFGIDEMSQRDMQRLMRYQLRAAKRR